MVFTREQIESVMKRKGYAYFDNGSDLNLNIIGIRNSEVGNVVTNVFDDYLTISYRMKGSWVFRYWAITTDPGKKGVTNYHNRKGVARLMPGQYRGSHTIGFHKGQYQALVQKNPLRIWRDPNRDMIFNENLVERGIFGINIHKAMENTKCVEDWSEGCQVFKRNPDFLEFMRICNQAAVAQGNSFTYTLLETKDFI